MSCLWQLQKSHQFWAKARWKWRKKNERNYFFSVKGKLQHWQTQYSKQASLAPAQQWRDMGYWDQRKNKRAWVKFNFLCLEREKCITPKHRCNLTPHFAALDNTTATPYTTRDISHLTQLVKDLGGDRSRLQTLGTRAPGWLE